MKRFTDFMSVCFKSFDVSHDFSKTAAFFRNPVVWVNLTIYQSMYDSNQFSFKQIKRVNDEEQLLRIFRSLYFEIKCNNHKKDSLDFFYQEPFHNHKKDSLDFLYQEPFLPLKVCIIMLTGLQN